MSEDYIDNMFNNNENNSKMIGIEYFQSGVEKFLEGMHDSAKQDFLLALEFDSSLVLSYCYLSSIYSDENDPDTSIELCNKGLSIDPENPHLHYCLGSAYDLKGLKYEAISEYQWYHSEFAGDAECVFSMANAYDDLGDLENAKKYYQEVVNLDPEHCKAYFNWSLMEASCGDNDRAIICLKKAVEIAPKYWKAWIKLGIFSSRSGSIEEAIIAYSRALELRPDLADVRYNLGISYKLIGKPDKAAEAFRGVVNLNNQDANAWHNLGVALFQMGKNEEALEALKRVIKIDLYHAEAHYRLACVYVVQGEHEKAEKEKAFLKGIDKELFEGVESMLEESLKK